MAYIMIEGETIFIRVHGGGESPLSQYMLVIGG